MRRNGLLGIAVLTIVGAGIGSDGPAPTPPAPSTDGPSIPMPTPPAATLPEALPEASDFSPGEARLLERVRQLEATIERLNRQVEQLQAQVGRAASPVVPDRGPAPPMPVTAAMPGPAGWGASVPSPAVPPGAGGLDAGRMPGPMATPGPGLMPGPAGGPGGESGPGDAPPGRRDDGSRPITDLINYAPYANRATPDSQMPPLPRSAHLRGVFGRGFQLASEDDEFLLQVNTFTMVDGQVNTPSGQALVEDGVSVPLGLMLFSGRITRLIEYEATFGNAFTLPNPNTFKVVFFYADIRADDRMIVRVGQQRVPFTYEYYYAPFSGLMNLDWSLFFHNFSPLAAPGFNVMGQLLGGRVDYSAGIYDAPLIGSGLGNPIAHGNVHGVKSGFGLLNTRPFLGSGLRVLEPLNLGASFFVGDQRGDSLPRPMVAGLPSYGIPFLLYDRDVRLSGTTAAWAVSMAYFAGRLSLQAEWEAGIQNLAAPGVEGLTDAGPQSFYVQAGYMLTGETVVGRGMVAPLRPIDPRRGRLGPGAWELAARYNALRLDRDIFRRGLADPDLWTSDLRTIDLGLNWYWNEYVKVSFGWKHIDFGSPVFRSPGRLMGAADQWLVRFLFTF